MTGGRRRDIPCDALTFGKIRERRTPGGKPRWYLDFGAHGRIYRARDGIGEYDWESREEAERYLARIRALIEDGRDPDVVLDQIRPRARRTIGEVSERWLEAQERRVAAGEITGRSLEVMRSYVRAHWDSWRSTPIEGVTTGQIDDWCSTLLAEGLAPSTVRSVLAYLHAFYAWLYRREEIQRIPTFPRVAVPDHAPRLFTREQQTAALEAIAEPVRGIFLALADCALRPSEARALHLADVREDGWLTVRRAAKNRSAESPIGPTKTRRVRTIPPLTDRLGAWRAAHPAKGLLLFTSPRGRMWSQHELIEVWRAACKRAGLVEVPLREGTRHSTATWLRESGAGLEVVQHLLGHTTSAHTQRYAQARPAELVRLVERLRYRTPSCSSE